jgi:hypothetical protein
VIQMMSPVSVDGEKSADNELPAVSSVDMGSPAMGHDFSNVRVCLAAMRSESLTNHAHSLCHHLPPHFYDLAVSLWGHSNQNDRSMRFRSKLNM